MHIGITDLALHDEYPGREQKSKRKYMVTSNPPNTHNRFAFLFFGNKYLFTELQFVLMGVYYI